MNTLNSKWVLPSTLLVVAGVALALMPTDVPDQPRDEDDSLRARMLASRNSLSFVGYQITSQTTEMMAVLREVAADPQRSAHDKLVAANLFGRIVRAMPHDLAVANLDASKRVRARSGPPGWRTIWLWRDRFCAQDPGSLTRRILEHLSEVEVGPNYVPCAARVLAPIWRTRKMAAAIVVAWMNQRQRRVRASHHRLLAELLR